jgi:ubiquitin-like protein Pup
MERPGRFAQQPDAPRDPVEGVAPARTRPPQRELLDGVDELLDEIDEVLEENAEEFIRGYVQKGGQ